MAKRERKGPAKPVSPASSGPAGSQFEAQVGASYLLAMLTGSEPRGLPETRIESVELQRAGEGNPLDDIVIVARDPKGQPAKLEVQVKRSIQFAPSDPVFASVVEQIVAAARLPGFWDSQHELAVATARTSRKIDGAYQDVLTWARQLGSSAVFAARIARPGSASDDMRGFVATFKSHLEALDYPADDESVWKLLRRFQILIYDFTAQGSAAADLAKERAVRALAPAQAGRSGDLWEALVNVALDVAASGGDRNREALRAETKLTSFRWAGDPHHQVALAALAEAGRAALADINDRIGAASIARPERIAAVHAALEAGRYVEIRGDAGVGKSGLLKHFAMQAAAEGGIVVLSPGRVIPRGWTAMRAALGFDDSARELLVELAADGSGILFVDNIDLFSEVERTTVNDLVRDAATVPGLSVIVTGRRNVKTGETNWLPGEALDKLGRTSPLLIEELNDAELEEIRAAAPDLASLLSESHPARAVTRNLFRLARLAGLASGAPVPQTEIDMAEQWWRTADGPPPGQRERARVIKALAEQAFAHVATFDVSGFPAAAIDALIGSDTLRDYGNDRVAFRHDVLREWAVAGLLSAESDALARLPLGRPAPASLARGMELYARSLIERESDDQAWRKLLEDVSRDGAHGSWRRAVLLALVRSEAFRQILTRAAPALFADNAAVLIELIRTTMAVDVQPGIELLAAAGLDITGIPAGFDVPSGPSWHRLMVWLLSLRDTLPAASIPAVVNLYNGWTMATFGHDPLTPRLLTELYRWLTDIEAAQDADYSRDRRDPFQGALTSEQIRSLKGDLRRGFAIFATRVPDYAAAYLRAARQRNRREDIARALHEFRGTLATAAPLEMAELVASSLIPTERSERSERRRRQAIVDRPFTHVDSAYLPASPAQGPFFDILLAAPAVGMRLIRRLIDHAISFQTDGVSDESEGIEISLPTGPRKFHWLGTYSWPRDLAPHYAVASGLMALEAWGHRRIEEGEAIEAVVADVIGEGDAPAAYLLVAVDLVISHWPASVDAAIPFLASPELIVMDKRRQSQDQMTPVDFFGFGSLKREPMGTVSLKSLKERPSRQRSLDDLLWRYAVSDTDQARERLRDQLEKAAARLGPPAAGSNLGDPAFMAVHALNLINPDNWPEAEIELEDGSKQTGRQYVSPQNEADHLAPFQPGVQQRLAETNMQAAATLALDDPARSSPELARTLVEWALARPAPDEDDDPDELSAWAQRQALMNIALIVTRDGDPALRAAHRDWAQGVLSNALENDQDRGTGSVSGLRYSASAIAFAGAAYSLRDRAEAADIRALLDIAARDSSTAARGFRVTARTIATTDERLPRAVLRCALKARILSHRNWELPQEDYEARKAELRQEVGEAIDAEMEWLTRDGSEPAWPEFPFSNPQARRGLRLPGVGVPEPPPRRRRRSADFVDSHGAALWLGGATAIADVGQRPWLRDLVQFYAAWTSNANGASLGEDDDVDTLPSEWNEAYFDLLARCLPGLTNAEIDALALDPIAALPSNSFLDVTAQFLCSVDEVYFNTDTLGAAQAVHIRSKLLGSLSSRYEWERFAADRTTGIEMHMGEAVSAFLFHQYGHFSPATCYLTKAAIGKMDPFLPMLSTLVTTTPHVLVAVETMNLLELAPKPSQLPFAVAAGAAWSANRPTDTAFWLDYAIGRRFCEWLDGIRRQDPGLFDADPALRPDVDRILAALVRVGVAEAGRLEAALA
jgi:hypothetical protein